MKTRSYLMYAANTKLTPNHHEVAPKLYVRAEPMGCNYHDAMDHILAIDGENFMNSIPARFKNRK